MVIASPRKYFKGNIVKITAYKNSKEDIPALILREISKEEYIKISAIEDPTYFEENKQLYFDVNEPYFYEVSTD